MTVRGESRFKVEILFGLTRQWVYKVFPDYIRLQ